MDKLILAQGAEHMPQDRLAQIVNRINQQKMIISKTMVDYRDKLNMIEPDGCNPSIAACCNDYVVEEKYDGYSYLNTEGRFFSKRLSQAVGKVGQPTEKTGHLPYLTHTLKKLYEATGCDLHGELYRPGGISDDVTKILGCTEDEAVRRTMADYNNRLRYMLIDIRAYKGKSLINEPYYIRRSILEYMYARYIAPINHEGNIVLGKLLTGDPRYEFTRIVNNGGEGIIIKRTSALYCPDKKPMDNWIKGKKKITLDAVITGYNDGTGKNKSLFGSIEFGLYINGKLQKCGSTSSGLNDETRNLIAKNPDSYIGTVIEIDAIQESVKSFRNAVFIRLRDDKNAEECTPLGIKVNDQLIRG